MQLDEFNKARNLKVKQQSQSKNSQDPSKNNKNRLINYYSADNSQRENNGAQTGQPNVNAL
jgi:hypothetical protein